MFTLLIVGCGVLGLVIGSFLNVVIYRVPRQLSVVSPPSACPHCETRLQARDNIPVVSWLWLRGKCRSCSEPIAKRYPFVELLTGALFSLVAARLGVSWSVPAYLTFTAGLIALSWIDVEHLVLPKALVYVHLAGVFVLLLLATSISHQWRHLVIGVCCALGWWFIFFLLNLINPRWLGFGDVRFSLVLGLGLGWLSAGHVVFGFFAANLIGLIVSVALLMAKKIDRSRRLPYGVFLSAGSLTSIVFAGPLLSALHLS
ncbi:MAG TPA: prepilin peptidase [Acidimicrobiales bacterium]|nr:prepilin peptidase [Acidimicrobiales bacterium]